MYSVRPLWALGCQLIEKLLDRYAAVQLIFIESSNHSLHFDTVLNSHYDRVSRLRRAETFADLFEGAFEFIVRQEATTEPVQAVEGLSQLDTAISLDTLSDAFNHHLCVDYLPERFLYELCRVLADVPYRTSSFNLVSQ